jgi:hypothetical protein
MSLTIKIFTCLFLSLFLFVEIANAKLIRSGGRGSQSGNFSQDFFYVDNSNINAVGITTEAYADLFTNSISNSVGGGGRGLGAVPSELIFGYTQDDQDAVDDQISDLQDQLNDGTITQDEFDEQAAALQATIDGVPGVWEFTEGEDLFTFGFFSLFFDTPDVMYDVNWIITNDTGGLWEFEGEINTAGDLDSPDGEITKGSVMLNSSAPLDLAAGDYFINVSVSLSSLTGDFFWENRDPNNTVTMEFPTCIDNPAHSVWLIDYDEWLDAFFEWEDNGMVGPAPVEPVEPDFEICGHTGVLDDFDETLVSAPTFFFSESELLRILPGSSDTDPTQVNAPASLGTILFGLWVFWIRKHMKVNRT